MDAAGMSSHPITGTALVAGAGALAGGAGFYGLHKYAFQLEPAALARSTPGPFIAFGTIAAAVGLTDRAGLELSDRPGMQLVQSAVTGGAIFGALTLASNRFHGTAQPLAVSTAVNVALGAVTAVGIDVLDRAR